LPKLGFDGTEGAGEDVASLVFRAEDSVASSPSDFGAGLAACWSCWMLTAGADELDEIGSVAIRILPYRKNRTSRADEQGYGTDLSASLRSVSARSQEIFFCGDPLYFGGSSGRPEWGLGYFSHRKNRSFVELA
jgi:hypothetical protein